jgi:hypothetical protein
MDLKAALMCVHSNRTSHLSADEKRALRQQVMVFVRDGDAAIIPQNADKLSVLCAELRMDEHAQELHDIVVDDAQPLDVRERALSAVMRAPIGALTIAALSAEARVALCGPWVRPMLRIGARAPEAPAALAALYAVTPVSARDAFVARVCALSEAVRPIAPGALGMLISHADPAQAAQLRAVVQSHTSTGDYEC